MFYEEFGGFPCGDSLWGFVSILASTTSIRPLHAYHLNIEGYMPALLCRNLLISRYPLSNRRYIEIIADIFRVVFDIFEKSLIYPAGNLPGYLS